MDTYKDDDFVFEKPAKPPPWFMPPRIPPNLGARRKRQSLIPRSKVEHVLLHDNEHQKNILSSTVKHLSREHLRMSRMTELHKRSFLVRQSAKQAGLWESGIDHVAILPELTVESHLPGAKRASMESSQRRYSMALRSAGTSRAATSAPSSLRTSKSRLSRAKTFHATSTSTIRDYNAEHKETKKAVELDPNLSHTSERSSPSGHLPRKPLSRIDNHVHDMHAPSMESLKADRSKTDIPLNLTKAFSTYDTKFRREVTISDPRNIRKRASEDPRFKRLRTSLIPPEKPIDSMLQLSPSGQKVVEKYGNSLYDYNELKAMLKQLHKTFPKREREQATLEETYPRRYYGNNLYPPGYALSVREAFVDDESLYDAPSVSDSASMIFDGAE